MFDKKMREPGEAVTDDRTKRKVNPITAANNPDEHHNAERRADEMKIARQRLRVFSNVKIPKFRVISNSFRFLRHIFLPQSLC